MKGYGSEEPIAAIATPLSPGAIGIVRTSGRGCISLVSRVFSAPKRLLSAAPNSLVYGWIVDRAGGNTRRVDEVMLGVYNSPRSFTGEDMVEIFCHGGINVVKTVLALLLRSGFRQAERGEFTFRAYINGKTDLTRAEAVKEIIDSKTSASRARAAGRLSGDVYREVENVRRQILDTIGNIEAEVEYPEDEENIAPSFDSSALVAARDRLRMLQDSWKAEKIYQDGARVVLCGAPNAGKSSLFNALLKEDRAIVSSTEGTTRDWLESWADFDGVPVRLFDTAGLRDTNDTLERQGVQAANDLIGEADIILYVVDSVAGISDGDRAFVKEHAGSLIITALNKCDVAGSSYAATDAPRPVRVSARTGEGICSLVAAIRNALFGSDIAQDSGHAGLGSERQKNAASEALGCVEHALKTAAAGDAMDAVVQDLEDALAALGEIVGETCPDDILENIFRRFCVGK